MKQRFGLFFLIYLTACSSAPLTSSAALPPPIVTIVHSTETLAPAPSPAATPTATPLPYLMYPYSIAGLREREFEGGEISLDVRLAFNDVYSAYLISYPSDGLRITGMLYIPAGNGPFPVIVMNHGYYPRSDYSSGDGSDRAAKYLVERGYFTISSDYRTWGGSDFGVFVFSYGFGCRCDEFISLVGFNSTSRCDGGWECGVTAWAAVLRPRFSRLSLPSVRRCCMRQTLQMTPT